MWRHRAKAVASALPLTLPVTCSAPQRHARPPERERAVLNLAALRPVIVGRGSWHADRFRAG